MNSRNLLALQHLKKYGIDIPQKYQKYIIAYPYQDDGGYDFWECELPVCENGDLIKVGVKYDTHNFDNCLVVGMKLEGYFRSRWIISINNKEYGEAELLTYQFLSVAF